jgi:hypothetical protein
MSNNSRTEPADDTAPKQRGVPFKPGQSGNPAGRPKGARSRLGEAFLSDLADAWADHGVEAIERLVRTEPGTFVKVVSNILPREVVQLALSVNASIDFADVEAKSYLAAYRRVRDHRDEAPIIDLNPEAETAWRIDDDD